MISIQPLKQIIYQKKVNFPIKNSATRKGVFSQEYMYLYHPFLFIYHSPFFLKIFILILDGLQLHLIFILIKEVGKVRNLLPLAAERATHKREFVFFLGNIDISQFSKVTVFNSLNPLQNLFPA